MPQQIPGVKIAAQLTYYKGPHNTLSFQVGNLQNLGRVYLRDHHTAFMQTIGRLSWPATKCVCGGEALRFCRKCGKEQEPKKV